MKERDPRKALERNLEQVNARLEVTEFAIERSVEQLLEIGPTDQKLPQVVFDTVNYLTESCMHIKDILTLEKRLGRNIDEGELKIHNHEYHKGTEALIEASQGKYSKMPAECSVIFAYIDNEIQCDGTTNYEKLSNILHSLPESGPRLKPPLPAWMDPRFNPERVKE